MQRFHFLYPKNQHYTKIFINEQKSINVIRFCEKLHKISSVPTNKVCDSSSWFVK
jgi:biotin synthase-related radical SAM superfamily protein